MEGASLTADDQYFLAEGHFIAACAQDTEGVLAFAAMLNRWNAAYAAGVAKNDPKAPSADSVRRVLSGMFAMRGCFPLLVARAPDAAAQLAHEFVQEATKDSEALLLPVKPNPKKYKSPARGISSFSASIFATANPTLNFVQNVVALAGDAHSRTGAPAEEIKSAWNVLVRQFMQENGNEVESFLSEVGGEAVDTDVCSSCRRFRRPTSAWRRRVATWTCCRACCPGSWAVVPARRAMRRAGRRSSSSSCRNRRSRRTRAPSPQNLVCQMLRRPTSSWMTKWTRDRVVVH